MGSFAIFLYRCLFMVLFFSDCRLGYSWIALGPRLYIHAVFRRQFSEHQHCLRSGLSPVHFSFCLLPTFDFRPLSAFQFKGVFIFRFLTWLSGVLLFYAGVNAFNSSYLLMLLLAFYCIPVNTSTTNISGHIFNRIAVIAATVQICIVYFLSGLYKLSGEMWVNGDAIYYTLELERFSREWVKNSGMTSLSFLMKGANYLILAYQLLFPIIIWIKKWRIPVLIVGTAFHLITMFVMNLWDFGFAMLIGYIIFFRKK